MPIRSQVLDELLKQQGNVLCANMCTFKKKSVLMFLPLLTCVLNDEITSCTETTGKTLSDQKHFILWRVNESSFKLFDLSQ